MRKARLLKIRNLKRENSGSDPALLLSAETLDVPAGACVSVTGASGSGKSLLLRAIADLDPVSGEVFLDNTERNQIPAPEWRRQVAYIPAESGWWDDRVGSHFNEPDRARDLVREFDLDEDVFSWPVQQLSTGERQRLSLIRALSRNPRVLLLDEPTSGLDGATTAKVEGVLSERMQSGVAIILVTHDTIQRDRLASVHFAMLNGVLSPLEGQTS
jgi:ABC-type iron transport system FetAB ATPase subunit